MNSLDRLAKLESVLANVRMFSFLIRESNVEGGNPSVAAAPLVPDIRPERIQSSSARVQNRHHPQEAAQNERTIVRFFI